MHGLWPHNVTKRSWQGVPSWCHVVDHEASRAHCSRIGYALSAQCGRKSARIDTKWHDVSAHNVTHCSGNVQHTLRWHWPDEIVQIVPISCHSCHDIIVERGPPHPGFIPRLPVEEMWHGTAWQVLACHGTACTDVHRLQCSQ